VGDDSHVFSGETSPREIETVHCHGTTASYFDAKVWGEVFEHFQAVAAKCHSSDNSAVSILY
jgi:hypothetical protein